MHSTKKNLEQFFNPRDIAVVGVPREGDRFGGRTFLKKFLECGFPGKLYPINPKAGEIQGLKAYPDLSSLPETPDLVIVSVAAKLVPAVLEECARIGLRHIHVLSSGFSETGTKEGNELEERIASISRENGLLVIGPNCMGPYCPSSKLTAWGAIPGMSGPVGIISQSGTITQRLTEYLCSLGIGVEKAVSMGNGAVLDSPDYLEFIAEDEKIRVIAMYLESVKDGRRFLCLVREVGKKKPIIIWKGGESEVGAMTVASHTGSLAGERSIWEAFFRQTGAVHVRSMNEWADAILTLCLLPASKGKGVFLIGGGGGNSVAHSDTCIREGLDVPPLSDMSMRRLRETVPVAGSIVGNPLDVWRIFEDTEYLKEVLELAFADPNVSMVVVDRLIPRKAFHMTEREDPTQGIIEFVKGNQGNKPTVFTVDSDGGDPELAVKGTTLRAQFCKAGLPAYPSLKRATWALAQHYRYHARSGL
ncbi:MAG: CoA-binding protein [Candidatus Hydrogenedentota bacterium]|nr:MAG: CoA-binding protein [Candidatus Hydrogenedentota bacterium]